MKPCQSYAFAPAGEPGLACQRCQAPVHPRELWLRLSSPLLSLTSTVFYLLQHALYYTVSLKGRGSSLPPLEHNQNVRQGPWVTVVGEAGPSRSLLVALLTLPW